MKELLLFCSYLVYSIQSCDVKDVEYYAGRFDISFSEYNSTGLPYNRKWLTHDEWQGRHIKNAKTRSAFSEWKATYRDSFIIKWAEHAVAESKVSKIPASIIISQAILESNWGISRLAATANNYFGHKYRKNKNKMYIVAADDSPNDKFAVYKSIWWCIRDHSNILNGMYKRRLKGNTAEDWLESLCGGMNASQSKKFVKRGNMVYATSCFKRNPCYSQKLKSIIRTYNLTKYDI